MRKLIECCFIAGFVSISSISHALGIYQESFTYRNTPIVSYATTEQFVIEKGGLSHGCRSLRRLSPPAPIRKSIKRHPLSLQTPKTPASLFSGGSVKSLLVASLRMHGVKFGTGRIVKQKRKRKRRRVSGMREVTVIHYPAGEYTLTDEQKTHLIGSLQKYKNRLLYIEGFTDCNGSREYNDKLAENRAEAVASFLKKHGFKVRVMPSYGKYHTLRTDEDSRRTVVYVAEKNGD